MALADYNLRGLLEVLEVSRQGSITRAAAALDVSQPALTRSLLRLERDLRVPLFERRPRGMVPTAFGEVLISHAQSIEAELKRSRGEIDALRGRKSGEVRIGATPLANSHLIPLSLDAVLRKVPRLHVKISEGIAVALLDDLLKGNLDLAIAPVPPDFVEGELVCESLLTEHLGVYARRNHPLSRRRKLGLADLVEWPWVLQRYDSDFFRRLRAAFESEGLELPDNTVESGSLMAFKTFIVRTDRIGVLPSQIVEVETGAGLMVRLAGSWKFRDREFGMFYRKRASRSAAVAQVTEQFRKQAAS